MAAGEQRKNGTFGTPCKVERVGAVLVAMKTVECTSKRAVFQVPRRQQVANPTSGGRHILVEILRVAQDDRDGGGARVVVRPRRGRDNGLGMVPRVSPGAIHI